MEYLPIRFRAVARICEREGTVGQEVWRIAWSIIFFWSSGISLVEFQGRHVPRSLIAGFSPGSGSQALPYL